jgi:Tfp pilus assembly protein PilO
MRLKNSGQIAILAVPVLVFSLAALVSLVIMRYFMAPQFEALAANKAVLASFSNSNFGENGNASIKKRFINDGDSLKAKYHDLIREVGGPKDLSGVLQMIIERANAADIKFVKMQPLADTKTGMPANYPMVLELTASYNSYGRFIAALETQPSTVRVDRIAITAQKNNMLEIRTLITCSIQDKP